MHHLQLQFLSAERKISTREIQAMLEKNDAALRGWNALHAQERTWEAESDGGGAGGATADLIVLMMVVISHALC